MRTVRLPLSHLEIICCSVDPLYTWDHPDLAAPYWRLYYHDRRGAYVVLGRKRVAIPARRAVVIPPYTTFASGVEGGTSPVVTQLFVHFVMPRFHWSVTPGVHALPPLRRMDEVAAAIMSQPDDREAEPGEGFRIAGVVMDCVSRLPASVWQQRVLDERIERAAAYMTNNYADDVSNEDLARAVQMSTRNFTRAFVRQMETTPHRYLMKVRLDRAAVLLRHSDRTIDQIAEECGFNERSYFTRSFTKTWGAAPAAFRRAVLRR